MKEGHEIKQIDVAFDRYQDNSIKNTDEKGISGIQGKFDTIYC